MINHLEMLIMIGIDYKEKESYFVKLLRILSFKVIELSVIAPPSDPAVNNMNPKVRRIKVPLKFLSLFIDFILIKILV